MKKLLFFWFLVYALFGFTIKGAAQSIKNHVLVKGRQHVNFKLNNGKSIDVSLSVPVIKPKEKVPLIIALHWAGGSNTYKEYSSCLAFPALEFMNSIIVAPSDAGLHWVDEINEKKLFRLINSILKHWPIDATKVIITGYSNGGIASWFYAEKYPDIFSAAIPMAGSYNVAKIEIPLYVIHGKKDELFSAIRVQNIVGQSIENGSEIQFTLLDKFSHYMACYYVESLRQTAQKLNKEVFRN